MSDRFYGIGLTSLRLFFVLWYTIQFVDEVNAKRDSLNSLKQGCQIFLGA
jgi:hypothetical protein